MDSLSTNTRDRPIKSVSPPATHLLSDAEFFTQDNFGASKPNVRVLRDHFFREGRLTEEHALFILKHTTKLLSWEPNMVEVQGSVTICGDIHGQYYDLLKLFDVGGLDSYLFLGNYVNRGYFGIECLLYLYVLKLWFPSKFTLLRGNHECHHLTEYFTFEHECLHKYTSRVYDACLVSFRALPVAALVDGRLLCVHGGLSPEFTLLSDILALNRFVEPGNSGLLCDLLWSDPIEGFGHEEERAVPPGTMFLHNAVRGCSFFFTYAAACQYTMYRKTLKMFPSVITLFSAPNYLDVYHNHGAILKYANQNITIRQYYESPHPYWLPNFQNAFTWSLPFVGEKITEMLRAILSICSEEELESDSDESEDELDADGQPRTRKTEEMRVRLAKTLGLPTPEGVARRRREIKNKIIAVGRVMRIFQLLREERESAAWLVDEEAESGALGVQGQIRQSMHNFEDA
ncbi:Metallo-dependent phosphatase-like protein [Mycena rebaudengoi]|nr:Metallo-dependent phosphatase-like protein [Mycena rebaudengoi]